MKRPVFILYMLLSAIMPSLGLSDNNLPIVNFHTPQEASLMKAIDNPVGLYNGNPEISYNLFTVQDGAVEIPLTLQYNASGIKVKQESTWVGLGWDLNVGGMIVQEAVGKLDDSFDYKEKYPYYPQGGFDGYLLCYSRLDDKKIFDVYFDHAKKRYYQPDVFYYNFPGCSGKFYIDYTDNSVHPLCYDKPIKIERNCDTSWIVTTSDGICHYFTGGYKAVNAEDPFLFVSRTWVLTATILPNGQVVRYYYGEETTAALNHTESYDYLVKPLTGFPVKNWERLYRNDCFITSNEYLLDSIVTDNYLVEFKKSPREDYYNGNKLDAVIVKDKLNGRKKQYNFTHAYSSPSTPGNYLKLYKGYFPYNENHNFKRLQLLSVDEVGYGSERQNLLKFDYYDYNQLPPKTSLAVDYWGFYNGKLSNKSLFPYLSQLMWNNNKGIIQNTYDEELAVRACSTEKLKYGMLHKITYATGGVTEFEYEPNEFNYDSSDSINRNFIPTCEYLEKKPDSIVEKTIRIRKDEPDNIKLRLQAGESMTVDYRITTGLHSWKEMEGTTVYILNTSGTVRPVARYSFTPEDTLHVSTINKTVVFNVENTSDYTISASLPQNLVEPSYRGVAEITVKCTVGYYNEKQTEDYSQGCGVRVKNVNYYNSTDDKESVRQTAYEYPLHLESGANGRLLVPVAFHRMHKELTYALTDGGDVLAATELTGGVEESVFSENVYSATYSTIGSLVGYSQVNVYDRISGKDVGYTENYFNNFPEISSPDCFQIPKPGNGRLVKTVYADGEGKTLKTENYRYWPKPMHFYKGVCLYDKFNRTDAFYGGDGRYLIETDGRTDYGDYYGRYRMMLYGLWSYMYQLQGRSVTQDDVILEETYTYDDFGQIKEKTSIDSRGKTLVEKYTYPYNYTDVPYKKMKEKYCIGYPIEQKQYCNGSLVGGSITEYDYFNSTSLLLPSFLRLKSITTPVADNGSVANGNVQTLYPLKEVEYLRYTKTGNPVSVKVKDEEIVYLWGYNGQYPIAEIHGCNYSSVSSLLGEDPVAFSERVFPDYNKLESLGNKLAALSVTIYRFSPLLGVTSVTEPNGDVTTYEYDCFGRLSCIKDKDGNIKETFNYHYKK